MTILRRLFLAYESIIAWVVLFATLTPPEGWPYGALVGLVLGVALWLNRKPSKGFNGLRRPNQEI
jgi:hypothetical protein